MIQMHRTKTTIICCAVATGLISLLVYSLVIYCGFVNIDDPDYVLNNPLIRHLDLDMVRSAFTQSHIGWWMPLTWISLAIDYHVWGLNPLGYHLTNIVLHAVNTALLVLITDKLLWLGRGTRDVGRGTRVGDEGRGTWKWYYPFTLLLAGLLWGIHPLRVESVAWVTERKDVLNGLFTLGAILEYLHYAQSKVGDNKGAGRAYALSLLFFSLSLMAKSVSVVLPLMLLVADWYPLERLRRGTVVAMLLEKIPFFALSALIAIATVYFSAQSQHLVTYEMFPFGQRLLVSGNAIFEYVRLLLFPVGIIAFYVIPDPIPPSYTVTSAVVLALCVAVFIFKKHRWLPATWLCFVIPLLPVLAFLQNGDQSFAARFTYLPALAPSIAVAFFIASIYEKAVGAGRRTVKSGISTVVIGVVLCYGVTTAGLIATWENSEVLWSRIIDLQPNAIVYKERGLYYYSVGNYPAAIKDFSAALQMAPDNWHPYIYNLYAYRGDSLRAIGQVASAAEDLSKAIAQLPLPVYFRLRGQALEKLGRRHEADADYIVAGQESAALNWVWIPVKK